MALTKTALRPLVTANPEGWVCPAGHADCVLLEQPRARATICITRDALLATFRDAPELSHAALTAENECEEVRDPVTGTLQHTPRPGADVKGHRKFIDQWKARGVIG